MNRVLLISLSLLLLGSCGMVRKQTSYGSGQHVSVPASGEDAAAPEAKNPDAAEAAENSLEGTTEGAGPEGMRSESGQVEAIVQTALGYTGTRYRYGGTTKKGMDCSGLLYVAFQAHDFALPRVSHEMADEGRRVRVSNLRKGDLLFFKTSKRGKRINHVGLVVEVRDGDVRFIHSTTSRGVIVSSLREGFWNYAFVKATRVF